jgi:transposase
MPASARALHRCTSLKVGSSGGSDFPVGRQLTALGHDVRLIPAQYVKPFLKGHKNDYRDAEAIAEAVQRPTMSFTNGQRSSAKDPTAA